MTKRKTFKEKVQSMKFSEIMQAMITSLKNPLVEVEMDTYGSIVIGTDGKSLKRKYICYGCAATNTICRIGGIKDVDTIIKASKVEISSNSEDFFDLEVRSNLVKTDRYFLSYFECAIDKLRQGIINSYDLIADDSNFAQIPSKFRFEINRLPPLDTHSYKEHLPKYQKLCTKIKKAGY